MKLNKFLTEMVGHFTPSRASDWLRFLFSSFETDVEPIAVDTTKNESAYFAEARRLGWVARLPETDSADAANKPLVVVAVKMKGDLTERTSRLVQFAFAKKAVQNAIARSGHGIQGLPTQGLFFFYDSDGYFRISLVSGEADGRKLKYNSAKRQSFYVDPTAANNILRRRLGDPIKTFAELKNAFSVEQLTKEFYGRLFDWYTWALAPRTGVTFPNDLADEKDDRKYNHEAIIRLITRLMFTWFIRQKIPVLKELFERDGLDETLKGNRGKGKFNPDSMEDDNYYRCILQNLFFATFNCPQSGKGKLLRRWINVDIDERGDGRGLSDDFNVTTVYRYRNEFKDADAFLERMRGVPFLNCALFDCLDKAERKQDGGRKLYFDGFSTKFKRQAHVPNGLFFKAGQGIIDLFNGYEFTINENSADDADVALDPELLGKVFENLLGAFNPETQETARKATGSFYTPREIVDYMVEESLKNYLKGKLGDDARDIDAKLDDLFDRTKAAEGARILFSRKEEEILLNALYDCKVLDPACGSGAFPMGVLQCMVRLLARLDPDSVSIRERLIARYRADKDFVDPTETAADRRERLAELEKCLDEGQHYPDYARKLYLIENCIYGVDIQPIATQISKLRFFISLLCDQFRTSFNDKEQNYGLLALPNLEAKFVCANTLISLPEMSGELKLTSPGVTEARERLKVNRHRIFGARSTKKKEDYKKRDLEIRDEIREAVINALAKPNEEIIAAAERRIDELLKERKPYEKPRMVKQMKKVMKQLHQHSLFDALSPMEGNAELDEEVEVLVDVNEEKRQSIDSKIFVEKKKIADEREKLAPENISNAQEYAKLVAGWDPFDQNKSSSFFDPEWMFNITDGFDAVIGNPPYVLIGKDEYKQKYVDGFHYQSGKIDLYRLFIEKAFTSLSRRGKGVVSFITPNTFLTIPSCIALRKYIIERNSLRRIVNFTNDVFEGVSVNSVVFVALTSLPQDNYEIAISANGDWTHQYGIRLHDCANNGYAIKIFASSIDACIIEKMRQYPPFAEWDAEVCLGLQPYHNSIHSKKQMEARFLHADHQKSKDYLQELSGRDIPKYGVPTGRGIWLNYAAELYMKPDMRFFSGKRIVLREIPSETLIATLAKDKLLVNKSCYIIRLKEVGLYSYLLGIINSRALGFWVSNEGDKANQNLFPRITMATIKRLPIPRPNMGNKEAKSIAIIQAQVSALVDKVLAAKARESNADTSSLEAEIDQLVYKLYGLTDDEIAIIEGKGGTSQEPQNAATPRPSASPRRRKQPSTPASTESTDDEVLE